MNKKQKVIVSLLKEIDEICRQNNIMYYLSPRLTLCAVTEQSFPQNPLFGVVLMKVEDMERFRRLIEEDPREKRALESMKSHKWFPGFYLRYENTDTICINLDRTRDYEYPGIGVNILPLRTSSVSGTAKRRISRAENGWTQLCDINQTECGYKNRINRTLMRLQCLINGRQRQASRLYERFCREFQGEGAEQYILRRRKQTQTFPAEIFAETKTVTLEGEEFQVPAGTEEYLTICYGNNYREIQEARYVIPSSMIVSARVSYAQFWKEEGNYEKYCKERRKNSRRLAKARKYKKYFNECWKYVVLCGARMNLGIFYKSRKDYIMNLYKNEDYMALEKVFRPYYRMTEKSLQEGEFFAEDVEIFDIYVDTLEKTGRTVQRSKISSLI